MIYLSDQGSPQGIYAVVTIDDHTRIILRVRVVATARPQAPLSTPQDADDFDLSAAAALP